MLFTLYLECMVCTRRNIEVVDTFDILVTLRFEGNGTFETSSVVMFFIAYDYRFQQLRNTVKNNYLCVLMKQFNILHTLLRFPTVLCLR